MIILWTGGNIMTGFLGLRPIDPPPFVWLQGAVSMAALYVATLIFTTQRREDQLSSQRDQLLLELTIANDQKSSKIIGLLEELRRYFPTVSDRIDNEARSVSTPVDPLSVIEAIKKV